jgi:Fe-S oxidoreductase
MIETLVFWLLFLLFAGIFVAQVVRRLRLVVGAPRNFTFDQPARRVRRFLRDVLLQAKTIGERPVAGVAHALVFWGFLAFAGYTGTEVLFGLGIVDLRHTAFVRAYTMGIVPFAIAVTVGILYLLVRRVFFRPAGLGTALSGESVLIALFIAALMITFLVGLTLEEGTLAARVNWWAHMLVILAFLAVIPASKHLHLVLSPATVLLKSPVLGTVPNLDFEKEEVGLETLKDLGGKQVLDAFTCVECGRCQDNCPAFGSGKVLNPKTLILRNQHALLEGRSDEPLASLYDEGVLWQCTTCGACENQCPVGIEHLPLIIGSRRGLVSNGEAPGYLGNVYNSLERRGNIWGLTSEPRQKFIEAAGLEVFDAARHEYLVWLGCAGAFEADFQKALRSLFEILRAGGVRFGVLARERCTGDVAKRSGNEYMFQELATQNIEDFRANRVTKIVTSCPHCLKTIGDDYRRFGFEAEVVHSAVLVNELTRRDQPAIASTQTVVFHDPCYLGRYAGHVDEPRDLLARFGGALREPERAGTNPFCCGAGGGLLFEEHEAGTRISDVRFEQLRATGAGTVVTACPFCSIMLKGAQASAGTDTEFVDLMTFVNQRRQTGDAAAVTGGPRAQAAGPAPPARS